MDFVSAAHHALRFGLFGLQLILGVWALSLGLRGRPPGGDLFSGLVVDEVVIVLQSVLGGILFATGQPPQLIHFLYGGLLLALLPVVYPLSNKNPQRSGIWLGLTLLFMAGLVVRASLTGQA